MMFKNIGPKPYVTKLLTTGIISGYDDGTFKPERSTTRAEFLRMLISALHEDPGVSREGHWAKSYENVAIEKGYLLKDEFDNLNQAITREEIAILVSRAINEMPTNLEEMKKVFIDYPEDVEKANHIAKIAGLGIIKGYDNGKFMPQSYATRAEVSTILIRVLDPTEREVPKKIEKPVDNTFIEPVIRVRHYSELSSQAFNQFAHNFAIFIDNFKEYDESYFTKVECINVPELNERDYLMWGDFKNYIRVRNDNWYPTDHTFQVSKGKIWSLNILFYTTLENMDKVKLYEGMELKFKISIKKGDKVKTYYQTVIAEEIITE